MNPQKIQSVVDGNSTNGFQSSIGNNLFYKETQAT